MVLQSVMKPDGTTIFVDVPKGRIPFVCGTCGKVDTCPASKPQKYCNVNCKNNRGVISAIRHRTAVRIAC